MADLSVNQFEARLKAFRDANLFDIEGRAGAENMRRAMAYVRGYRFEAHAVGKTVLDVAATLERTGTAKLESVDLIVVHGKLATGGLKKYNLARVWEVESESPSFTIGPNLEYCVKPGLGLSRDGQLYGFVGHKTYPGIPDGQGIAVSHLLADHNGLNLPVGLPIGEYLEPSAEGSVVITQESPRNTWIRLAMFAQAHEVDLGY